jgi:hypothetical protein
MMNNDIAEVGDLIKIIDPVWDWLKKDDVGVIIKRKLWQDTSSNVTTKPDRYTYRVRFATTNQTRIINRNEFKVLASTKI